MLRQRAITAVIAALALLAVLFVLPQAAARIVIAILLVIGAWEWSSMLGAGIAGRTIFMLVVAAFVLPHLAGMTANLDLLLVTRVALAWWFIAFLWTFFYPTRIPPAVAWLAGVLVIVPAYVSLDWLYLQSPWLLLLGLLPVWLADIGAYFAGKTFGRVKLAPAISPGKTWEGVIGGMLAIVVGISLINVFFPLPLKGLLPLCLAIGAVSVVGDLTVSMFKRNAGVKDSGSLFPGHGGFLDRADGITAAAPVFVLGLSWLASIPGLYPV